MGALAILQARMSSNRLPGKVLLPINGSPMIYWQIKRILESSAVSKLIIATSTHCSDDLLCQYLNSIKVEFFRGSLNDVHSRFFEIVRNNPEYDTVIRLTADCPMTMPHLIDSMCDLFSGGKIDYLSNAINPTYPDGVDIELFNSEAFMRLSKLELSDFEKEHVTYRFLDKNQNFKICEYKNNRDLSNLRLTVDYSSDYQYVSEIFKHFEKREFNFTLEEVVEIIEKGIIKSIPLPAKFRNITSNGVEREVT
jgi:spore coat polysaccharide biosynthesis protein SpsF (cytidylyltransferase family)